MLFEYIFVIAIAKIAVIIDVIHTGRIISAGFWEPIDALIAISVDGISWIDAVFKTTNIHISSLAVCLSEFIFSSSHIAFSPKGVAAFARPKMFAIIFIEIALSAAEPFFKFGNKIFVRGLIRFANIFVRLLFSAILSIPHHIIIAPAKPKSVWTLLFAPSKAAEVSLSKLPVKKAHITEIKIKNPHI